MNDTVVIRPDDVAATHCDTWDEFCVQMRKSAPNIFPLYRGQADIGWGLVPPSARGIARMEAELIEQGHIGSYKGPSPAGELEIFKHLATGLPGVDVTELKEIDIEALGRHHGLATRLLDWTSKPYVAAFFAFSDALNRANDGRISSGTFTQEEMATPTTPVSVWRLTGVAGLSTASEFEHISTLASVNFWQKAQSGSFTKLVDADHYDLVDYLASRGALERLHRFIIPGQEAFRALADLENMNITFATLFPDLRGAALQANLGIALRLSGLD